MFYINYIFLLYIMNNTYILSEIATKSQLFDFNVNLLGIFGPKHGRRPNPQSRGP